MHLGRSIRSPATPQRAAMRAGPTPGLAIMAPLEVAVKLPGHAG